MLDCNQMLSVGHFVKVPDGARTRRVAQDLQTIQLILLDVELESTCLSG